MIEIYSQNFDNVWFGVALDRLQIIASSFSESQQLTLNNILALMPYDSPFQVFHERSASAEKFLTSLKNIYDGKEPLPSYPLAYTHLPAYTQRVLKATAQIPLGYVTSYGLISKVVGGGARAVGNVMASNPFAPIVPCHRVVKSDFSLGGYGGGLKTKVELLNREKRSFSTPKEVQLSQGNLKVFPVEYALRNLVF